MLLLLGVLSLCSATAQAAYCYSHDGVEIKNSKYYDGDSLSSCREGSSTCCLPGESCGEDLLCHSSNGVITRQYCTDPTWPSEFCSALCPEFDAAGVELTKCEENVYCCGPDNKDCCKKGKGIRIDKRGQIVAVGTSTLPVTSTTVTSTTSDKTTTEPATTTTGGRVITPIPDPSNSETLQPGAPVDVNPGDGGLSAGAGVGIGIGCAVAVGLIIALVWFFLRERKKRRALEAGLGTRGPAGYNSPSKNADGYYQPSMQETQMSSPVPQIHEAPAEPAVPELHGNSNTSRPS